MAHARILGIDSSAAAALPGTQVFTAADIDLAVNPPPPFIRSRREMYRPFIASEKVRFVGDIVAVVLSETPRRRVRRRPSSSRSSTSRCRW